MLESKYVTEAELQVQRGYMEKVLQISQDRAAFLGRTLRAHIDTYGCQQNEDDSEKLMGMLVGMGYVPWPQRTGADLILLNTCAVREHAEQRVYGNLGALKKIKETRGDVVVGMCGCMAQQPHLEEIIREKYRHVNLLFGTHALYRLPQLLYTYLSIGKNVYDTESDNGRIAEGLAQVRANRFSAFVTVMSGCNNFCSYCIVPYVRGRERSRRPDATLCEVKALVADGCKEITLLGQNVNSYGQDLEDKTDFSALLTQINALPGDFRIKFMTSHPKDINHSLIDAMAACEKVCRHLHLPVQSGSDTVLERMNRRYTAARYLDLIGYARTIMPDITLSSDIIVGFPGETEEDFAATLALIKRVEYDMLFSFIFSRRKGTPAYDMEGQVPYEEKLIRFNALQTAQEEISARHNKALEGQILRVLCTGRNEKDETLLTGRTDGNKLVFFPGSDTLIGQFVPITVTQAKTWFLFGENKGETA